MKDLLSGGFQSAHGDMSQQIAALSEQLRGLVAVVSETTQQTNRDAATRSDEMRSRMEALLLRTNEVLVSMQAAQDAVATTSTNSAALVRNEVATAVATTRAATSDLDQQSRRVEASLGQILQDLEKALKFSGEVVSQFALQTQTARDLTRASQATAEKFATGSDSIRQASVQFAQNLLSLENSIGRQHASQKDFVQTIPDGISRIQERLSAQTKELNSAWAELEKALDSSVRKIAGEISEPIDNLGDHVRALNATIQLLPGTNGARK